MRRHAAACGGMRRHAAACGEELRLFRLRAWDLVPAPVLPVLEALESGADLEALGSRLPPNGRAASALRAFLSELPLAPLVGRLAARRLARPAPGRKSYFVDVWRLDAGVRLPSIPGRIDYFMEGAAPGWYSGAAGAALVVSSSPAGRARPTQPR